jgi:hypothetical protein
MRLDQLGDILGGRADAAQQIPTDYAQPPLAAMIRTMGHHHR